MACYWCYLKNIATVFLAIAVIRFILKKFVYRRNSHTRDLEGSTVLLTGGSVGIGRATLVELVRKGARVIFTGRDVASVRNLTIPAVLAALVQDQQTGLSWPKAESLAQWEKEIKSGSWDDQGNYTSSRIWFRKVDFADLRQIEELAKWVKSLGQQIHIMINNAGSMFTGNKLSAQGYDMAMGVNHFAHYYLTELLFSQLAEECRVINVASSIVDLPFVSRVSEDIDWEAFLGVGGTKGGPFNAYANSKLANIMFTVGLQEILNKKKKKAKAVSLHPGVVASEFSTRWDGLFLKHLFGNLWTFMGKIFFRTILEGSQTTLYCVHAALEDLADGGYYSNCCHKTTNKDVTPQVVKVFMDKSRQKVEAALSTKIVALA